MLHARAGHCEGEPCLVSPARTRWNAPKHGPKTVQLAVQERRVHTLALARACSGTKPVIAQTNKFGNSYELCIRSKEYFKCKLP